MSIQSSLNSMLATASVAAGLYQRSDAFKVKQLNESEANLKANLTAHEEGQASPGELADVQKNIVDVAKQRSALQPTTEHIQAEQEAIQRLNSLNEQQTEQKKSLEWRKQFLANAKQAVETSPSQWKKLEGVNNGEK